MATWAVVRLNAADPDSGVVSLVRGNVGGWFSTLPRAELPALLWHLRSGLEGGCRWSGAWSFRQTRGAGNLSANLWKQLEASGCSTSTATHARYRPARTPSAATTQRPQTSYCILAALSHTRSSVGITGMLVLVRSYRTANLAIPLSLITTRPLGCITAGCLPALFRLGRAALRERVASCRAQLLQARLAGRPHGHLRLNRGLRP